MVIDGRDTRGMTVEELQTIADELILESTQARTFAFHELKSQIIKLVADFEQTYDCDVCIDTDNMYLTDSINNMY